METWRASNPLHVSGRGVSSALHDLPSCRCSLAVATLSHAGTDVVPTCELGLDRVSENSIPPPAAKKSLRRAPRAKPLDSVSRRTRKSTANTSQQALRAADGRAARRSSGRSAQAVRSRSFAAVTASLWSENRGEIIRHEFLTVVRSTLRSQSARRSEAARYVRTPGDGAPRRVSDGSRRAAALSRRRLFVALHVLHAGPAPLRTRRLRPHRGRARPRDGSRGSSSSWSRATSRSQPCACSHRT